MWINELPFFRNNQSLFSSLQNESEIKYNKYNINNILITIRTFINIYKCKIFWWKTYLQNLLIHKINLIEELKEKAAHTRLYFSKLNSATYSAGDAWRAVHLCGPTVF